jgi:hypothetical protein
MRALMPVTKFKTRPAAQSPASGYGVRRSSELVRVRDLARRSLSQYGPEVAEALSLTLVRPGSKFRLRAEQAAMLLEASENGGLFSMSAVGVGKTVVAPLFGRVMGLSRVVLLVPATLRHEIAGRVIPKLRKEIDFIPPAVVAYSQLQSARFDSILEELQPQLIVADEAHYLKNKNAARTKRFLRYLDSHPDCQLVAMSGTMARRSIRDFWEIIKRTHKGERAPITRQWKEAEDWARALDPGVRPEERIAPGALMELTRPGEDAREGFSRRLLETEGVVGGGVADCPAALTFRPLPLAVPASIQNALEDLRLKWELPSGELVVDALDFYRKARELAQGFYYIWVWPNGIVDREWLDARKQWRSAVAGVTKLNRPHLDSELLVRNAAEREENGDYEGNATPLPKAQAKAVVAAWLAWKKVKDRPEPPVEPVWLNDFIARAAVAWSPKDAEGEKTFGLVWYDSRAVVTKIKELDPTGFFVEAGEGEVLACFDPSYGGDLPKQGKAYVTSAYATGKNLQRLTHSLDLCPSPSGAAWEQKIGRMHRPGQEADEVVMEYFAHTEELQNALQTAVEQAEFLQKLMGPQKILLGDWIGGMPRKEEDE